MQSGMLVDLNRSTGHPGNVNYLESGIASTSSTTSAASECSRQRPLESRPNPQNFPSPTSPVAPQVDVDKGPMR